MELTDDYILRLITYITFQGDASEELTSLLKLSMDKELLDEYDKYPLFKPLKKAITMVYRGTTGIPIIQEFNTYFKEEYITELQPFFEENKNNLYITSEDIRIFSDWISNKMTEKLVMDIIAVMNKQQTKDEIDYTDIKDSLHLYYKDINSTKTEFNQLEISDISSVEKIITKLHKKDQFEHSYVSTGLDSLDEYTQLGGLDPGRLMYIAASSGVGKSISLLHTSYKNYRLNKKVLYITLENTLDESVLRWISMSSNLSTKELALLDTEEILEEYEKFLMKYKTQDNYLEMKYFPTDTDLNDIMFYIKSRPYHPDLVVLDYLDLAGIPKHIRRYRDEYIQSGKMVHEMKHLAGELKTVVATASQLNRQGIDNEDADLQEIATSIRKAEISDLFLIMRQSEEMYQNGRVDYFVGKSRISPKKIIVQCSFDPSSMSIKELSSFLARPKEKKKKQY